MVCIKKIVPTLCLLLLTTISNSFASQLAFVANVDGNWELFTMSEHGSNLQQLTSTPYDEKDPSWSSDRKKIVYATSDGQLNVVDIATKKHDQIILDNQKTAKISPSFSQNNKQVAFVQFVPGAKDDTNLKIFDTETQKTRTINNQYAAQHWPAWSPDGNRIVYTSAHCSSDCGRIIQELWIADPNGGYARQILMSNSLSQQPAWSPNGNKIAFSSDRSGNFDIWVLSIDNWELKQFTIDKSLDVSPAWSPDGKRIAFISTRAGKMEIWIKDVKTGEMRNLRPFGGKDVEYKDVEYKDVTW